MESKLNTFLQQKQQQEETALLQEKHRVLKRLHLQEKIVVENHEEEGYDERIYDAKNQRYIYYKYEYPEISDEVYRKLRKYEDEADNEGSAEQNGEDSLIAFAYVTLFVCILAGLITTFTAMSNEVWGLLGIGVAIVILGLYQLWITKAFANISRKATAIYELLKEREQK